MTGRCTLDGERLVQASINRLNNNIRRDSNGGKKNGLPPLWYRAEVKTNLDSVGPDMVILASNNGEEWSGEVLAWAQERSQKQLLLPKAGVKVRTIVLCMPTAVV